MNAKRRIYNTHTCKHTNITLTFHLFLPLPVIPYLRHTRNVKETINDANDRAIRSSSSYFQKAIQGVGKVVLITNDADNQVCCTMCKRFILFVLTATNLPSFLSSCV